RLFRDELVRRLHAAGWTDVLPAHSAVFAFLDPAGTRTTDLVARAGISKQAISQLLQQLTDRGYIEARSDPIDRRLKVICLTARGRQHLEETHAIIRDIEARWAAQIGAGAVDQLRAALALLTERSEPPSAP
ncbi:MAG: winged helix-turn-helix transcriptional regulator, partial [Chloroflexi bacterium]|nr:winged helix-turn-helix transcriptional regulator [Chloroflexota bacterium]